MGHYIPNIPYQQPFVGTGNVLPLANPEGGNNYQTSWSKLGGTYAAGGTKKPSNIPLAGGFNPSQQGGYTMPYDNRFPMGGYAQYPNQMGPNP